MFIYDSDFVILRTLYTYTKLFIRIYGFIKIFWTNFIDYNIDLCAIYLIIYLIHKYILHPFKNCFIL